MNVSLVRDRHIVPDGQACPACSHVVFNCDYSAVCNDVHSRIYKCPQCGMMFAFPTLIDQLKQRQMDSIEDAELFGSSLLQALHEKFILSKEVKETKRLLDNIEIPKLLDVGCGTGWATNFWKENGFEVTGLEPSAARGKVIADKYGFDVHPVYIEEFPTTIKYDVLTFRHIIEHLEDPAAILAKAKNLLNEGGLVMVVVPNIDAIGRHLFQEHWEWVLPWHTQFFNSDSLCTLLENSGFTIEKKYQTPSPLYYKESFFKKYKLPRIEKMMNRFGFVSMLPFAFIVAIGMLCGLSENVTVIARKR